MRLVLHPKVYSDVSRIMEYYEQVTTPELADEFYRELRHFIVRAAKAPESYAIRERDIRRVNLPRFLTIFCSALRMIRFGFLLSAITAGIRLLEYDADNKNTFSKSPTGLT